MFERECCGKNAMFCGICCEKNNNVFVREMADNQKDDVYPSFIVRL